MVPNRLSVFLFISWIFPATLLSVDVRPRVWWTLDEAVGRTVIDASQSRADTIRGFFDIAEGVVGKCLRFDGYTTAVVRKGAGARILKDAFTIEAWVAPQTYSWNWTAVVNQEREHQAGFFFGIDVTGHVGLHLALDGRWIECNSAQTVPLLKWSHLAAVFDPAKGIFLYVDGEAAGSLDAKGRYNPAEGMDLLIGKNQTKMSPKYCEGQGARAILSDMVFDGLIDEVKIYDTALSAGQIRQCRAAAVPSNSRPLAFLSIPTGPQGPGGFGASSCRLYYSEPWDRLWRIGDFPDILVRFDESPVKLMFWHGTCYGGVWITENGLLMADQSLERAGKGKSPWGCPEHMSDKQARYSSVRILENSDARVVIRWRYALSDIRYNVFGEDLETGWGEWAEEEYCIYPDAVSTRHQILWSGHLSHEWQETIVLHQPGTFPEDNLDDPALLLAGLGGVIRSFSWINGAKDTTLRDPVVQMANVKSRFRPFLILQPGAGVRVMPGSDFARRGTHYLWWNHWPVAQIPSDGTKAYAPDKPSHTSLSQTIENSPVILHEEGKKDFSDAKHTGIFHDPEKHTFSAVHLTGLTDRAIGDLLPLARSWNFPAEIKIVSGKFTTEGYDKTERAYVLDGVARGEPSGLCMEFSASEDSPLINPAFVINQWGKTAARLMIDGKEIKRGREFRLGHRQRSEGSDLVVWIRMNHTNPVKINLIPE